MKSAFSLSLVFFLALSIPAFAQNRFVPLEYQTIREAIAECNHGDVIILEPTIYTGPDNRNIDFMGLAITIKSTHPYDQQIVNSTVIDCQEEDPAFIFHRGEDANSVLAGLTIINGNSIYGGAINFSNASNPTLTNCVITANSASFGGAFACGGDSRPLITNCTIMGNSALLGGAIYCNAGSPTIRNSIISGNLASLGGAINSSVSSPAVRNCTFTGNEASSGGAIYCYNSSTMTLDNTILWANTADNGAELFISNLASVTVFYCDIQGGQLDAVVKEGCILNWNIGSITDDPCFVQLGYRNANDLWIDGDYHLLENSPCIDTGNPHLIAQSDETDIDGDPRLIDGRVDIGADEFSDIAILAYLVIYPHSLNLASKAHSIKCHIWLQEGYNILDVDPNTVSLGDEKNRIVPHSLCPKEQERVLMARFSRSEVQEILPIGLVELTVTGELLDGTKFKGADTIKVINKQVGKPPK
ncbi:MAG: right-handed parallel beta-helix repeat-containing protein [Planctomycetota bacterium]|nr:MAG: right-handed parallel beta-helix repeat-containing protein [Planctomycetota bacterium]